MKRKIKICLSIASLLSLGLGILLVYNGCEVKVSYMISITVFFLIFGFLCFFCASRAENNKNSGEGDAEDIK